VAKEVIQETAEKLADLEATLASEQNQTNQDLENTKKNLVDEKNTVKELLVMLREVYKKVPEDGKTHQTFLNNLQNPKDRSGEMTSLLNRIDKLKTDKRFEKEINDKLWGLRNRSDLGITTKDLPKTILEKVIKEAKECTLNKSLKNENKNLQDEVTTLKSNVELLNRQRAQREAERDKCSAKLLELQSDESSKRLREAAIRESVPSEFMTEFLLTKYASLFPVERSKLFGKPRS